MTEPRTHFDDETHMSRALELARTAVDRGDNPFGSVLVHEDRIVAEESNRVNTENDIRRHPELHLAHRACREFDAEKRSEMVMYTSTEPCPMCAGGIATAGFDSVVYSVSAAELGEFTDTDPAVTSTEILSGITDVIGPILNQQGRQIHDEFEW